MNLEFIHREQMLRHLQSTFRKFKLQRQHLSTYYDSQSGIHVTRNDNFQLHDINTFITQDLHSTTTKQLTTVQPNDAITPASISIDISMTSTSNTMFHHLKNQDKLIETIKSSGYCKANLINCFEASPNDVQLIAAIIADAEVDVICLCDTSGKIPQDEEDAADLLQDYIEAVTWLDVVGVPLVDRIGLRLFPNENSQEIVKYIMQGGDWRELPMIRHWDVDEKGVIGLKTEDVKNVLLEIDRPDACRGGGV